jgi:hypothetical protein
MKYRDFYFYLTERYGGAAKERGIWYHGTSMKRVPAIMSRGLDPNISPKNKSWGSDPQVDITNLDKSSYGGVYVTQNLMTATGAASRTARIDKTNKAIIILSLQPRSMIADEDEVASRIMALNTEMDGSIYHSIYPYMWEMYGAPNYHEEYASKTKDKWVEDAIKMLFFDLKIDDPRFKKAIYKLLYDEGYKAMLIRTVSYLKGADYSTHWQWRKAYADVHRMKDYGEDYDIPNPPSSVEGERIFRAFVDKITRTMKHKARHSYTTSFAKTARSMDSITFHGSNKIIAVVEIKRDAVVGYQEHVKILYGELPDDFKTQWQECLGELRIVP